MERISFHSLERATTMIRTANLEMRNHQTVVTTSDWKAGLPMLAGSTFSLRELQLEDAPSLMAMLTTEEVARFISPPPTTVEGFERFITWANNERQAGNYACFAVVPEGMTTAVGIFQVRSLEKGFTTAEWGFAIGSEFWGSGVFVEGARMVVNFAVDVIGVNRLEARASRRCTPTCSNAKPTSSSAPSWNTPVPQYADPIAKPHSAVPKPGSSSRSWKIPIAVSSLASVTAKHA